jgi:hypothetical protein
VVSKVGANKGRAQLVAVVAALTLICGAQAALAQVAGGFGQSYTDDTISLLSPHPMERQHSPAPIREYAGLPLEGWMLYPSLFLGGIYDDNILQTSIDRKRAAGFRLGPGLLAERKSGVHKTTVYAMGDIRLYPGETSANAPNAQIGFIHDWEPQRDFTLRAQGGYAHLTNVSNSGFVTTPTGGTAIIVSPQHYDTISGSVSGVKSFDRIFVGLAGTLNGTTYDNLQQSTGSVSQSYRNNIVYDASGRLGYAVSSALYAFSQAEGNITSFNDSIYDSHGYRLVSGLGSDRLGLFRGEIYAGYQRQFYEQQSASGGSPVYGGKLIWSPTPAWTVNASLDETYQSSALALAGNTSGGPAHVTAALVGISYAMSKSWSASVRGGYSDAVYIVGGRVDHQLTSGVTFNYTVLRNLLLTFDYTFFDVISTAPSASFVRNQFTLGTTYKY